jgi:hypothetical protein
MSRHYILTAAMAASLISWSAPSDAQGHRDRSRAPQVSRSVEQYPAQRSRSPDLYSTEPGRSGIITATTPNQWGNLGGPSTGGGGGGGP